MRILILGGTKFIGRHIAETLLAAGHTVTLFNRGATPDELPAAIERLRGDRDQGPAGLQALQGRSWDACVDTCGYTAPQVRAAATLLRPNVRLYIFISAVATYGDPQDRPVLETHPQLPPAAENITDVNGETYGPLKVTCENILREIFGDACAFLRPQIVVGPHDASGRYSYWARRSRQPGEMLAPGDGTDHVQVIDVRDLARFTKTVIENHFSGPFNVVGHRLTWRQFITLLGAKNPVWVPAEILRAAGVTESEIPLYRPEHGPRAGLMHISNARAHAAGLTLTHPEKTLADTRAWLANRDQPPFLSPARESELIRQVI